MTILLIDLVIQDGYICLFFARTYTNIILYYLAVPTTVRAPEVGYSHDGVEKGALYMHGCTARLARSPKYLENKKYGHDAFHASVLHFRANYAT